MSASARDLLVRGKAAAKSNDIDQARFYLEWVLQTDAAQPQRIDAWWWLAEISADPAEKREHLENILAHQPGHAEARRSLAILDGRLDPAELIDPTHRPARPAEPEAPRHTRTDRFTCPNCNGQMRYSPDGQSLECPYCQRQLDLAEATRAAGETVDEQDFAVALATARGHSHAVAMQSFQCQGCGVSFMVGPAVLSVTCPYCASAHVIRQPEEQPLIPPEAILPFVLAREQAHRRLQDWLRANELLECQSDAPRGLYLPVWTFDVGGEIRWRSKGVEVRRTRVKTVRQESSRPLFYDDLLVPASRKFAKLAAEFRHYRLDQLVPYDPAYLADWPAETYQLSTADASLTARRLAYTRARREVLDRTGHPLAAAEELTFSSAGILVTSYKLILLPAWIGVYQYQARQYNVFINGQSGRIKGGKPRGRARSWWDKLLGR